MAMTLPTLTMNPTTTNQIDYSDNGKGDNDADNTEMAGNDVNGDDAHTYDDDYHCYYDDESHCFRYQIMRNCWQEEPDDRPSFEHLRHKLKLRANQHKVTYRSVILSVKCLSYNIYMNWVFFILSYSFANICPIHYVLSSLFNRDSSTWRTMTQSFMRTWKIWCTRKCFVGHIPNLLQTTMIN